MHIYIYMNIRANDKMLLKLKKNISIIIFPNIFLLLQYSFLPISEILLWQRKCSFTKQGEEFKSINVLSGNELLTSIQNLIQEQEVKVLIFSLQTVKDLDCSCNFLLKLHRGSYWPWPKSSSGNTEIKMGSVEVSFGEIKMLTKIKEQKFKLCRLLW